ncbi:MAG: hypothetical protein QOH66_633 [Actinomycetota bacterium]|jgi:hypothetical protein|nr:hypothetical protein [Actinomycetota bacterium]
MLRLTYVVPVRLERGDAVEELAAYLQHLTGHVEVVVVDGSLPAAWQRNHAAFGDGIRHLGVDPRFACLNGKVAGVTTGIHAATHEKVVVADDDVRYDPAGLRRICDLLYEVDLVRPQNYFDPRPWHAVWDTGRALLNRAVSSDYPGTLGLRRSTFLGMGGYDGDVLFENLELIRTALAAGAKAISCRDLFVRRLPPSARRFWSQRVRQAYDDLAVPGRMAIFLGILPSGAWVRRRWGGATLLAGALACVLVAERGRRRDGGAAVFPLAASLVAPVWLVERAICSWLALGSRVFLGGCRYRGTRIRTAAHSRRELQRRRKWSTIMHGGLGEGSSDEHEGLSKRADAGRVPAAERLRFSRQDRGRPRRAALLLSGVRRAGEPAGFGSAASGTRQA